MGIGTAINVLAVLAGGSLGSTAATLLRVEGFGPSVAYRIAALKDLLGNAGPLEEGRAGDCVLVGEEPRIAGYREEMRARLAGTLGVEPERVNVRATTTDLLGFTGRGEGLAALAVALLERS